MSGFVLLLGGSLLIHLENHLLAQKSSLAGIFILLCIAGY